MASSFGDILAEKRILVCAGSGGVGKTTTSAALALQGALAGKKTLVLTIDPAKRLANALGLPRLDHEERQVPTDLLRVANGPATGPLHAMMLDQKRAFDEVVERYARDPAVRQRILDNRIYQQISSTLSGSHEYAAMAKLYQIDRERDYDLVVVDTPPTAHALDFLDAPAKVAGAIDSPAIDWLTKPFRATGRFSLKLVGMGGSFVLKRIARFVGSEFLEDMARFFVEFNDVLGGFRERAREVFNLLRRPDVGFVLVASPDPSAIDEALFFHRRLMESGMPFAGFVVNRVHALAPPAPAPEEIVRRLSGRPECGTFAPYELRRAADAIVQSHGEIGELADADHREIARLRQVLGAAQRVAEVPFLDRDVHSIESLADIGRHLHGGAAARG